MTSHEPPTETGPWYVKFIAQVGVPSAIAVGLVYFLTFLLTGALKDLAVAASTQAGNQTIVLSNQREIIRLLGEHTAESQRTVQVILAICMNAAKDQGERDRCLGFTAR